MAWHDKRFKNPEDLENAWEEYKEYCDNQTVLTHDFSAKNSEFVSKELRRAITYTIEGFCVFVKFSRQAFYDNYDKNKRYAYIVTRMREECAADARKKFELGMIPTQLAALWMSKHGYSAKVEDVSSRRAETPKIFEVLNELQNGNGQTSGVPES